MPSSKLLCTFAYRPVSGAKKFLVCPLLKLLCTFAFRPVSGAKKIQVCPLLKLLCTFAYRPVSGLRSSKNVLFLSFYLLLLTDLCRGAKKF
jgi:hypothetical protein